MAKVYVCEQTMNPGSEINNKKISAIPEKVLRIFLYINGLGMRVKRCKRYLNRRYIET